jgi:hypothetical protein
VRVGKRLFDDGAGIPEKTLVTLGDDVVLNAGAVIQCHSLEDGTFKSDYTVIGSGAVLGVAAFVHYGVTMGEGTILDSDAFLMKGEQTAPFTHWAGNPATETRPTARPSTITPIPSTAAAAPIVRAAPGAGHLEAGCALGHLPGRPVGVRRGGEGDRDVPPRRQRGGAGCDR